jgi:hypothetical protein
VSVLDQLFEARSQLRSWAWRISHLYWILTKSSEEEGAGRRVLFQPNFVQRKFRRSMWLWNLILKSRQHGCTTDRCIDILDACLFRPNIRAGIVAHTREDAGAIFAEKILYPYMQLPPDLRGIFPTDTKTKSELYFPHSGSRVRVGTSLRSGTFDILLITEFGKLCARFPDKAKEIVTGTLETAHPGSVVTIESTAEGREGYFFDFCVAAHNAAEQGKTLGPMDFKLHFFAWWQNPTNVADPLTVTVSPEDDKYLDTIEGKIGRPLSVGQRAWYVSKKAKLGDDMKREHPSTWEEAFEASIEGTYLASQFTYLRKQGRIKEVPWNPRLLVHTSWDIGRNDTNTIWFLQRDNGWKVIDVYAMSHEGAPHYAKILAAKPYVYGEHYIPHDGGHHEWGTNKSRKQTLEELGLKNVRVVPRPSEFSMSVENLRAFLVLCSFDEKNCKEGIAYLERWKKDFNEKLGVWLSQERHDEASHYAAGLRTIADAMPRDVSRDEQERKKVAAHNEALDKESQELWG